jgi:heme exporter protein C
MKKITLAILGLVLMLVDLYLVFNWVPMSSEPAAGGAAQNIIYLMVPTAWLAMLAFVITAICGIAFLAKKNEKWDVLAQSSAEVGIVFTTLACAVGAIWAKPLWGIWWSFEIPRLTTTLILWFLFLACILIRSLASEAYRGAVFASVVAIIGLADIPMIILSTTLWGKVMPHPGEIVFEGGYGPQQGMVIGISVTTFTVLFVCLLLLINSMKRDEIELRKLKELNQA